MAHVILDEGLEDKEFIAANTESFDTVRETVLRYPPEEAEKVTGVPAETIREVARAYATTEKAGIYYTLGITEHTTGTDNVYALSNLVLMTGHLGKRSAGMNPLRGQNNVQGANDAGATPVFLPGYQRVDDPEVCAKFSAAWGVEQKPEPGLNLNEMMKAMSKGELRGMYLMGEDIVISEPNVARVEEAMNEMEFVVVQDIFFNESCRYADVVLPAACFAEKDGVFANSDRRVQRVRKAVEPPGEARADWQILAEVMRRAGYDAARRPRPGRDLRRDGVAGAQVRRHLARAHRARGRPAVAGHLGRRAEHRVPAQGRHPARQGALPGRRLPAALRVRRRRVPAGALHRPHALPLQRRHPDPALGRPDDASSPRASSRSTPRPPATSASPTASWSTSSAAAAACAAAPWSAARCGATRSGCRSTSRRRRPTC